jgi:hypothetical protein
MNRTHLEHAIFALLMQLPFGLFGFWWVGAALAIGFFTGREHAQREYHIGDPSKLPPWAGFDYWRWPLDSQLDLAAPVAVVLGVALFAAPL